MEAVILLIGLAVCAALGRAVAGSSKKGLGTLLGLLLGPIGVLISAVACKD